MDWAAIDFEILKLPMLIALAPVLWVSSWLRKLGSSSVALG
jgi:hypothetical protein